ncbi:phosphate regulon sensor kinase PhoR [Thioploca ingrica]|uniref:Phosphate regulon sensor protein PhoR n=1 Tax=Thioploca ingrica TaxID=40754 RepID=A0A090APC7_9GAMM|nr:phosphate regulon sensor kinase PhoR [Thioploca ingrica]
MSPVWLQEFWYLVGLVLGMLLIGWWVGQPLGFLLLAILLYLGWHLYNLYQLERWFRLRKKKINLPDTLGIWGEVFYHFYRLQQRNRKHKRKISAILKRFQSSTAAMPDAAVVLGKHYEIEWLNKSAQKLLGLQSPQDRGKPITNFIRSPVFLQYLTDSYEQSTVTIVSPTNHNLILKINVVPYAGNQHLLLARDTTQLHRLEQIRRDFIANVSHELRTPLTVLAGFIETLRDDEDECTQQWERPLLLMAQQSARMRNLIEDLLLLSRLESDTTIGSTGPVRVAEMLHTICEEARILSGEQAHRITLLADENLVLEGRREELRSAFSNLIFNAVRYTPAQGDITVRWYQDEKGMHFEVSDTGEGIAPEHLPRLAERFYRVDVGRSRQQGGTGLGLAIVKHVLLRHQGQLHIDSILGQGSTFRCDFPLPINNETENDLNTEPIT